jgi:hypothetical protein
MYNTVREVHIAITLGLNQIDSNRKQAFRSEHYDALINTEILQYINDKIDPKSNPKREGFESVQHRVDELKDLKKSLTLKCYDDTTTNKYCILPSDYYRLIVGGCTARLHYNKSAISKTATNETRYINKLAFADDTPSAQGTACYVSPRLLSGTALDKTYTKSSYSKYSKFEIIQFFLDYIKKDKGYDCYWEYYNGTYTANTFIIISTAAFSSAITLAYVTGATGGATITTTAVQTTEVVVYNVSTGNIIYRPIELVSTSDKASILRSYYMNKNRHNQPLCTLDTYKLNINYESTYLPLEIAITYIIKPRLINYYFNTMPDIPITNEIIQRVIDKIKVLIKDEQAYNMFLQQMQQIK